MEARALSRTQLAIRRPHAGQHLALVTFVHTSCQHHEPMRAEGPKVRPTAVLSDQLRARVVHAMSKYGRPQKYYALADITLLRFDVYTCCVLRVPKRSRVNATAITMSSYSVVRHVYHGASSRRDRELKHSSQPIAKDQATRTTKAWIFDGDSSLCGPSKTYMPYRIGPRTIITHAHRAPLIDGLGHATWSAT